MIITLKFVLISYLTKTILLIRVKNTQTLF